MNSPGAPVATRENAFSRLQTFGLEVLTHAQHVEQLASDIHGKLFGARPHGIDPDSKVATPPSGFVEQHGGVLERAIAMLRTAEVELEGIASELGISK